VIGGQGPVLGGRALRNDDDRRDWVKMAEQWLERVGAGGRALENATTTNLKSSR